MGGYSDEISYDEKTKLLGTHNLRKLGVEVNRQYAADLNISDLAYLKDFYFEARYPGDNFVEVSREDRNKCLEIVNDVLNKVKHLCDDVPNDLKRMNSF